MIVCDRCGKPINNNPCSALTFPKVYVTVQETLVTSSECDLCKECQRAIANFVFGKQEEAKKE